MFNSLNMFDQFIQIPGVTNYLAEISYHRYGGATDTALQGFASRGAQYKIDTSHLELIGANQNDLYSDLTIANVSSWQQFALAYPLGGNDDGSVYYDINDSNPNNPSIVMESRTKLLRQYFKFVRNGCRQLVP